MPDIVTPKKGKRRPGRPTNPLKRCDLIAVSQVAFAEKGYAGTTLATIANLIGIQKASLYYHFASKEELYIDVMRGLVSDLRQLVAEAKLEEGDFVTRIDRLGAVVIDYLATHREAGRLLVRELVGDGPYIKSGGGRDVEATLAVVSSFLRSGMDAGAFRRQDARHLALSIVGVHLFYFAASEMTSAFMGKDIYDEKIVGERKEELLRHVRSLVLPE